MIRTACQHACRVDMLACSDFWAQLWAARYVNAADAEGLDNDLDVLYRDV